MILHGFIEPDVEAALSFLDHIYENASDEGWLNLFHIDKQTGNRVTTWAPIHEVAQWGNKLLEIAPRGDVWFSVAPRQEVLDEGRRGGVADCLNIPAFWLDLDVAGEVHKLPGLPKSYEEARQLVLSFELMPSAVVRSGYGLQCWWRLSESLDAADALDLLERWQVTWDRLAGAAGLHVDNVSNMDRVMRLPGTFNFKGSSPVMVAFKANRKAYEHSDIAACLDALPAREERTSSSTSHLAGSRFNEQTDPRLILREDLGCELVRTDPSGDEHWHYPKSENLTSCTYYVEDKHITIWSETMATTLGVEVRRPYDPFGFWVRVRYGGDFALAHAALVQNGIPDLGDSLKRLAPTKQIPTAVRLVTANTAIPERVEWIWPSWLPKGKLVMLDGDPDVGKSTMTLDLASRISRGDSMPDGSPGVGSRNVVLLSAEDDMNDTIIWRLQAADADLSKIHHLQAAMEGDQEVPFAIPRDTLLLEKVIGQTNAALVIVDVLYEYFDEGVDSYKDQSVRRALYPVRSMAQRTGAAVLMLRHFKKGGESKAIYRGGGSIGIVGAARAGWAVAFHPDDESMRILAATKMNLALRPHAMAFKLVQHESFPCARVDWRGSVEISADHLLDPGQRAGAVEKMAQQNKTDQCQQAIKAMLSQGDMWSNDLHDAIVLDPPRGLGIAKKTYDTVRADLTFAWREKMPDGTQGWRVRLK